RRLITKMSARQACQVLTISQFSKQEIVRLLGVSGTKVDVTYLGVSSVAATPRSRQRDADGTVLFVGSIFNRRHVPALIEGFAGLAQRHPTTRLEIVGDNRTNPFIDVAALADDTGVGDRIRIRSYVPDEEL